VRRAEPGREAFQIQHDLKCGIPQARETNIGIPGKIRRRSGSGLWKGSTILFEADSLREIATIVGADFLCDECVQ